MWRRRPSSARTASALSSSSSTDSPSRTSWRKSPSPQAILLFGLRALSCACAPYLARACIYVNDGILLSVDTRPEADRLGVTDRVVEDHRSRVERLCHAIEARVSISSRLLMMSNTSNRILLIFLQDNANHKATREEEALLFFACSPLAIAPKRPSHVVR